MAAIKKYNGSTWETTTARKYETATETIQSGDTIYADGNNATVSLKGNTVQNGTPTPDNPIMPEGTGDLETVGAKAGQYKIPISTAQNTTNIYLSSTSSTRQIKKYVFTGNENMRTYDTTYERIFVEIPNFETFGNRATPMISTHYQGIYDERPIGNVPMNSVYSGSVGDYGVYIKEDGYTSSTDFKDYLTAQFTAGTPVTIWYAISTAETGIVNEPLQKIGTYADSISNAASIPTVDGANSITVDTTVQPSEFTATWTGWHDAEVKEHVSAGATIANLESMSISQMENLTIQELQGGSWV